MRTLSTLLVLALPSLAHAADRVYPPDADLVLIGARMKDADGAWRWLAYDCAGNAWVTLALGGADPVDKAGTFNNSMGLMYDLARKFVWAVGRHSQVYALSFDPAKTNIKPLR